MLPMRRDPSDRSPERGTGQQALGWLWKEVKEEPCPTTIPANEPNQKHPMQRPWQWSVKVLRI